MNQQRNSKYHWLLSLCLLSIVTTCSAWNATGHRLVAAIAWDHLSLKAQQKVGLLLEQHPDYKQWGQDPSKRYWNHPSGNQLDQMRFIAASTWADEIKAHNPSRPHNRNQHKPWSDHPNLFEAHNDWHFLNYLWPQGQKNHLATVLPPPNDQPSQKRYTKVQRGHLDRAFDQLTACLQGEYCQRHEQAGALVWLIHLVADAHQPLHTISKEIRPGVWDGGGNGFKITDPFHHKHEETNLHAYWDALPGSTWLKGRAFHSKRVRLNQLASQLPNLNKHRCYSRCWIEESVHTATEHAYPFRNQSTHFVITERYQKNSQRIADERLAAAGVRLANLLNTIFH